VNEHHPGEQPRSAGSQYTVGEAARLSHVSVRTLHHYDEIGLLEPSGRSPAGYRLYSESDLRRLQQIMIYRELDFGLEEIAQMLAGAGATANSATSVDEHLRRQHRLLRARRDRAITLLAAIEREMEARKMGISLTPEEQFEIFGTDRLEEHAAEAEQRWGDTEAWQESRRRTAAYTKQDWIAIKAEADANIAGFADALRAGQPADGAAAMDLAEAHRAHLTRWFYDCSYDMHRGLAELYISDPRFTASYEEIEPGFSQYVHDAILANAHRHR
jgi:MerR family transcriptional regulator, thiopeptide resistance regulator